MKQQQTNINNHGLFKVIRYCQTQDTAGNSTQSSLRKDEDKMAQFSWVAVSSSLQCFDIQPVKMFELSRKFSWGTWLKLE